MDAETVQFKRKAWKARNTIHVFTEEDSPFDNDSIKDLDKQKVMPKRKQSTQGAEPMETNETDNSKRFKDYPEYYAETMASSFPLMTNGAYGSSTPTPEKHDKLLNSMKQLNIQKFWHVNPGGASGTTGGLVMIWKNNLDVEILDCSFNHINVKIQPTSGPPWLFTGYYGNSNNTQCKLNSWKVLEYTTSKNSLPWLVIGDFNFILHDFEKYSTQPLDHAEANIFSNKIIDLDLNDLGSIGRPFTWTNKISGPSVTKQRLDRGLSTESWLLLYPNSTITNLLSIGSDHHPIFLNTNPYLSTGKIPFKFFGPWLDHKDCKDIIFECWQKNLSGPSAFLIARKLKEVNMKLKIWNKEVYGNIKTNIEECKQHLHWLQENYFNQDRSKALQTAIKVLREWQDIEEKFWKIKSRDQYIKLGDKNTSYFHRTTKSRLRRNKIDTIQDSSGNCIENYQDIKQCFTNHFSKMATSESPSMNTEILNLIPTVITTEDNKNLNRIPEDSEVKVILFIMAKDKAPGPDGFPPNFLQANWDIIGDDLVKMVQHFFKRGLKGNKGSMGIKIDMAKAFDRVDWKFLHTILVKIGFNSEWSNKIMQRISTTSTVVLLNGSPDKFFNPTRGLRRGDPLSPYLFFFCMEALSRTLSHDEEFGLISGVKICRNAPSINHLLFVDDYMVFCKENTIEAQNLKDILNIFGDTSGQLINFSKSGVFFSKDTDPGLMPTICKLLGVQILPTNDKYLGSPLFTHRSKIQSFKPGVDKMKRNLSSWNNSPLNPAGREVIIKYVTSIASIYQMNCFRIPKQTCQNMNKVQRDFFWGKNLENPTGYYPKAWTDICKPKDLGGLGFMNMELFNSAMITKIGWRLDQDKDSLWYKLMDAKYLFGRNVLSMNTKAKDGDSWIWKGVLEDIQNIQQHYQKEWNIQLIQKIFSSDTAQVITNLDIHPREEDIIHWNLNNTGKFSIKALYKAKIENLYRNDQTTRDWRAIWNLEVAPAVKSFLWKCAHEVLPTNAKTASILHYVDPICKLCNCGEETMTRMFLNCPAAT
ncbi:uncharacterized protein LOC113316302 [Papaver somniferum]|uniref:uncharacterized protein LOC113316302 n=1 Tax=Papaver somniferum TaxID=3469 RepID=UPI000E6FAF2E|nr:uncharacterized protein LOC113316302 [Papaver somniferum]